MVNLNVPQPLNLKHRDHKVRWPEKVRGAATRRGPLGGAGSCCFVSFFFWQELRDEMVKSFASFGNEIPKILWLG